MVCTVGPASTGWRHCACLYIYFVPFWNYRDRSGFERAAALLAELRAAGPPGPGAGLVLLEGHSSALSALPGGLLPARPPGEATQGERPRAGPPSKRARGDLRYEIFRRPGLSRRQMRRGARPSPCPQRCSCARIRACICMYTYVSSFSDCMSWPPAFLLCNPPWQLLGRPWTSRRTPVASSGSRPMVASSRGSVRPQSEACAHVQTGWESRPPALPCCHGRQ